MACDTHAASTCCNHFTHCGMQILECESNPSGSVLAHLDYCVTPGGKRMLRGWLAAPMRCTADIRSRQDAVAELLDGAVSGMEEARSALRAAGDIERGIVRLAASAAGAVGRDAPGVVLYENPSRRKVRAVTALLRGLEAVQQAVEALAAVSPTAAALKELVTWDQRMPDFRKALEVTLHVQPYNPHACNLADRVTQSDDFSSAFCLMGC